jgi:nicotinamide-nucleotide amidase
MTTDTELLRLAEQVGRHLLASRRTLVTAESCTGGWIGKAMTDVPGSSAWFAGGALVYSNALKQTVLGVHAATLAHNGAVSEQVVREMVAGALAQLGGDVAVAVTGIAGPDGGTVEKPVGTVWFAWALRPGPSVAPWEREGERGAAQDASASPRPPTIQEGGTNLLVERQLFSGDREAVRRQTVHFALARILAL